MSASLPSICKTLKAVWTLKKKATKSYSTLMVSMAGCGRASSAKALLISVWQLDGFFLKLHKSLDLVCLHFVNQLPHYSSQCFPIFVSCGADETHLAFNGICLGGRLGECNLV